MKCRSFVSVKQFIGVRIGSFGVVANNDFDQTVSNLSKFLTISNERTEMHNFSSVVY